MVGFGAEELLGQVPPMPYWAPEAMDEYQQRFSAGAGRQRHAAVRDRVFSAPTACASRCWCSRRRWSTTHGRQTGWMSSILDISDRKRVEELNRQQQEKLQASARLATMGEMASTLAHELNQPLAAISSYTTGALNLLAARPAPTGVDPACCSRRWKKPAPQAQRAGHIIRSVHRLRASKREPQREPVAIADADRRHAAAGRTAGAASSSSRVQIDIAPGLPPVLADRVLLEQVLLNLTRNAIEAMQDVRRRSGACCASSRSLEATPATAGGSAVAVIDRGHGIRPKSRNACSRRSFPPRPKAWAWA